MTPRHFLELRDHDSAMLRSLLDRAAQFRRTRNDRAPPRPLAGRTLAMLFEKPSTRTRVSFEVGMKELGGHTVALSDRDMQLGRGETIADTARVLSRYVHAILLRTGRAATLREFARHASVPVINGLTDKSHPCQLLADILTFEQLLGPIRGQIVAWCGDGNNMARTWIEAAARFEFSLRLAIPPSCAPPAEILAWAREEQADITLTESPLEAVQGARAVVTDCWHSMADDPARNAAAALAPYRVTTALMRKAASDAIFLHCLPAHRGEEVEDAVMDGPQSAVWQEAENRLHAQKSVLAWCMAER